jgi:Ca2+-binding RTX toxin-like protein
MQLPRTWIVLGLVIGLVGGGSYSAIAHDQHINGTPNADNLVGHEHRDIINSFGGGDTVLGHPGDDRIFTAGGGDAVGGGDNQDYVEGGDNIDTIEGRNNPDTLLGESGNDFVEGGGGNDVLRGGDGDFDRIEARDGAPGDEANGGAGNEDTCKIDTAGVFPLDAVSGCENF